jgi:hypothetical protein
MTTTIRARIYARGEVSFVKFLFLPSRFVKLLEANFFVLPKLYECQVRLPNCWSCSDMIQCSLVGVLLVPPPILLEMPIIRIVRLILQPVRLAYQPPASSTFLSEQISHKQTASSTFLSQQISTSHQPPAKRTGC